MYPFYRLFFSIFLFLFVSLNFSQTTLLVDFGNSPETNNYGLDNWDQLLLAGEMNYSSTNPEGVILSSGFEEFTDYMGVMGTERNFSLGERIVVTWYNTSDETIYFTARISFDDTDQPNGGSANGAWFTMRSFDDYRNTLVELLPNTTGQTCFNITDSGVHKSDGSYSCVNINLAVEWGQSDYKQYLVCDKIELFNDADVVPPSPPSNLSGTPVSDSKVELTWDEANDNIGVVEYLIYMNDEIEGYSRENSYTVNFLRARSTNSFRITALDACRNESEKSNEVSVVTNTYRQINDVVNPRGLSYLGAFILPEEFAWGGEALAYNPDGDSGGSADGYGGSLFATNLNQQENGLVGEVNIPQPVISPLLNIEELNTASILQVPTNIRPQNINDWSYVDIWRTGLEYLPEEENLYSTWSIHYTVSGEKHATISSCSVNTLETSTKYGAWYLGESNQLPNEAMMSDYLFSIPGNWREDFFNGHNLVTGRFRDGGLSGLGPTLYAFSSVGKNPPNPDQVLEFTTLLEYGSVAGTDNYNYPNSVDGYKHSDSWREALWISTHNQNSVIVIGNKGLGDNWYGYFGENMKHEWVSYDFPYPDFYATDPNGKGWRSHRFIPMAVFYNPSDLAAVADGSLASYVPQPYGAVRFDESVFFGNANEIRSAAFDPERSILYATEFDVMHDGICIIHCWQVDEIVSIEENEVDIETFQLKQNYPNPFNPTTVVEYNIPSPSVGTFHETSVQLFVYDILGRKVATLVNQHQKPGSYKINFDAGKLASGIYYYQLKADSFSETKKMLLIK